MPPPPGAVRFASLRFAISRFSARPPRGGAAASRRETGVSPPLLLYRIDLRTIAAHEPTPHRSSRHPPPDARAAAQRRIHSHRSGARAVARRRIAIRGRAAGGVPPPRHRLQGGGRGRVGRSRRGGRRGLPRAASDERRRAGRGGVLRRVVPPVGHGDGGGAGVAVGGGPGAGRADAASAVPGRDLRRRGAERDVGRAVRGDRGSAGLPLARDAPRRGAALLRLRHGLPLHRAAGDPPHERLPPPPHRRPGLAAADRQVPQAHRGRLEAAADDRGPRAVPTPPVRRRRGGRLFHQGRSAADRRVRREAPGHRRARDRYTRAQPGRHRQLPRAGQHRHDPRDAVPLGHLPLHPERRGQHHRVHEGRARRDDRDLPQPVHPRRRRRGAAHAVGRKPPGPEAHARRRPPQRRGAPELVHPPDGRAPHRARPPAHRVGRDPSGRPRPRRHRHELARHGRRDHRRTPGPRRRHGPRQAGLLRQVPVLPHRGRAPRHRRHDPDRLRLHLRARAQRARARPPPPRPGRPGPAMERVHPRPLLPRVHGLPPAPVPWPKRSGSNPKPRTTPTFSDASASTATASPSSA